MNNNSYAILESYLASVGAILSQFHPDPMLPVEATATRLFLMGVTDFLRQANNISNQDFIKLYSMALEELNVLPSYPVEKYMDFISNQINSNETVNEIVREGAESIFWYVKNDHGKEVLDLLSTLKSVQKKKGLV
jgi:hypothetical protein|tara:strand:+ start:47 stop:451 length:405 start_codon:yes stop_codon:yes gene_type:complete